MTEPRLRCLIVDDEPLALDILENYIQRVPSLQLVRRCANALEAYDFLQAESVDLIFLDIHMPELTGIDFLKALSRRPQVVFTTAYSNYALEGFNLDVTDYLIKPIAFDRFLKAVDKAVKLRAGSEPSAGPRPSAEGPSPAAPGEDGVFVKADGRMVKIRFEDVLYVESMKDYVQIHTAERRVVTHHTMKGMDKALPGERFLRIHRSFIVAVDRIEAVDGNQVLIGGRWLPVGANHRDDLMAWVQRHHLPEH